MAGFFKLKCKDVYAAGHWWCFKSDLSHCFRQWNSLEELWLFFLFFFHRFPQGSHSYETENKTWPCDTPNQRFSTHTKISLHVQIVQMETCICSINCRECSRRVAFQNPSAEKYGVKKPQGMQAVCSPCSASVSVLHFQNSGQAARTQRGKGMCKNEWREGKQKNKKKMFWETGLWTSEPTVQYFKPRHRSSRCERSLDAHIIRTRVHRVPHAPVCCAKPQNAVVEFFVGFHERRYEKKKTHSNRKSLGVVLRHAFRSRMRKQSGRCLRRYLSTAFCGGVINKDSLLAFVHFHWVHVQCWFTPKTYLWWCQSRQRPRTTGVPENQKKNVETPKKGDATLHWWSHSERVLFWCPGRLGDQGTDNTGLVPVPSNLPSSCAGAESGGWGRGKVLLGVWSRPRWRP